jgi:hypothetical protein
MVAGNPSECSHMDFDPRDYAARSTTSGTEALPIAGPWRL